MVAVIDRDAEVSMAEVSPFRPGFGGNPPVLAGREGFVAAFREALEPEQWRSQRASLMIGARGVGKTALLNAFEDVARSAGWIVVSETAQPGMLDRLEKTVLPALLRELDPKAVERHVTGASIAKIASVDVDVTERHTVEPQVRAQLETLIAASGTGVFLSIDELHSAALDDVRPLLAAIQHAVREDRPIAFAGAGLPEGVDAVLQDPGTTFLRRAIPLHLETLTFSQTLDALRGPIEGAGRAIGDDALDYAARASQGYPYLVQLIGDLAWKEQPRKREISLADVRAASADAVMKMGEAVHAPAMRGLTKSERGYVDAMATGEGAVSTGAVAERMGISKSNAGNIRRRLIAKGIVRAADFGDVEFVLPYTRQYLRRMSDDVRGRRAPAFPAPPDDLV